MMYIVLFMLGLCFGSFINAFVWRVHKQSKIENRKSKFGKDYQKPSTKDRKYSILYGHSMCPNCEHQLAAKDLVPVFSWISLNGKCRYCKKSISWKYPIFEMLTALLFAFSWVFWPVQMSTSWQYLAFITWLIILVGLIAMAIYDAKYMIFPTIFYNNRPYYIVRILILIAMGSYTVQFVLGKPIELLPGILISAAIGFGFFGLIYVVSRGKWIGDGDIELGLLLGLLVATPANIFITLFLSSVLGVVWSFPSLVTKKLKLNSHLPFGPFLIIAGIIVVFFGQNIVDLYRSILLI